MKLIVDITDSDYKLICNKKENAITAHDTCKRIAKGKSLIEELEKIKTELEEETDFTGAGHLVVDWETIEKVIDNRIFELKGKTE